jgi:hypothetical protein
MAYTSVLGLKRQDGKREDSVGAGGADFTTWSWPNLEIQFADERFPFLGSFVEFTAKSEPLNLLGRKDFFNRFTITFWDAAELFNVDLSPDYPRDAISIPSTPPAAAASTARSAVGRRLSKPRST